MRRIARLYAHLVPYPGRISSVASAVCSAPVAQASVPTDPGGRIARSLACGLTPSGPYTASAPAEDKDSAPVKSVWLDCDPGHDDAFAIFLCSHSPALKLLGISTVAGNQSLAKVTVNAHRVLLAAGRADVPVVAGQEGPLLRATNPFDPDIHGDTGLDHKTGLLPAWTPTTAPAPAPGVVIMAEALMKQTTPVTLIATGCLTNVALLLMLYPQVTKHLHSIVLMGGGVRAGNAPEGPHRSSTAEFNIARDPEAAQYVFDHAAMVQGSGGVAVPVVMVPLDLTHTVLATPTVLTRISQRLEHSAFSSLVVDLLTFFADSYRRTFGFHQGPPLHDPCAVAYVIAPHLFVTQHMRVDVECRSPLSTGQTVCDLWGTSGLRKNVHVALSADVPAVWALLIEALERTNAVTPVNGS